LVINKKHMREHQQKQKRLDLLRSIAVKTNEQQKEFIDLKYPKSEPFKWTFKNVGKFILKLLIMVSIFISVRYIWKEYIKIELALWLVMLIAIFLPIIVNKILKKYNLHQDDLSVYFGGNKK